MPGRRPSVIQLYWELGRINRKLDDILRMMEENE